MAFIPFMNNPDKSLIYYGSIAKMTLQQFTSKSADRNENDELRDLRRQVYNLSIGLERKFYKLKLAGWFLALQFSLFIPLVICLIKNLKINI